MKVGIICAGDREVAPFLPIIDERKETEKAKLKFYEGKIQELFDMKSGKSYRAF